MAATVVKIPEGTVIYSKGDPLSNISLIGDGMVECTIDSYVNALGKTDILGYCGLLTKHFVCTYTAVSDVTLYQYPCDGIDALEALMGENADITYLMVSSACRQAASMLRYRARLKGEVDTSYDFVRDFYEEYSRLCKQYGSSPKKLPGLDEVVKFSGEDKAPRWVHAYYIEISELPPATHRAFYHNRPGIQIGFMRRCVGDISLIFQVCALYYDYVAHNAALLLSSGGYDLFSLVSDLHIDTMKIDGADFAIESLMTPISEALSDMSGVNADFYQQRIEVYWEALENARTSQEHVEKTEAPKTQGVNQSLVNSVETIIKYAECDEELATTFADNIRAYTGFTDRNGTDDEIYDVRRSLTKAFYEVYKLAFIKSLNDSSPPTIINMFLNFGFVDPILAGNENANFLFSIADSYKGDPSRNIFTVREWLAAIYRGDREPSLSEFDMDFAAYVKDMKNNKQIDANTERRLLQDQDAKLKYEMENAFPVVNRVTFGNPSKFCPVFADHNVLRSIEGTLVTAAKVTEILDEIREIDFSAFYRETAYSNVKQNVQNETIHVEVLPNIILMPNVGNRGSMWQEIEGRLRTTPARMFMPIFLENDLKTILLRLTADFRWEMCKRIQGARWNDMTDPSITSYYCDYLQFYMNNRNIAMQTMTEIRNEISSARNNYKTVFSNNYVAWVQNEAKGQARLNSIVIGIFMTFMPFPASLRETLSKNMRYNDALQRYGARRTKRVKRLSLLVKNLSQNPRGCPQELKDELMFAQR
ncbi:MAG: cyclic nucleotide-binding domain-containing protein [Oscillospiraceae bacterium]|jgi:hypothetical protein|nr:cyclic nucleotide-binding domain-containing protein [Oscillospiraceae bacterium]